MVTSPVFVDWCFVVAAYRWLFTFQSQTCGSFECKACVLGNMEWIASTWGISDSWFGMNQLPFDHKFLQLIASHQVLTVEVEHSGTHRIRSCLLRWDVHLVFVHHGDKPYKVVYNPKKPWLNCDHFLVTTYCAAQSCWRILRSQPPGYHWVCTVLH